MLLVNLINLCNKTTCMSRTLLLKYWRKKYSFSEIRALILGILDLQVAYCFCKTICWGPRLNREEMQFPNGNTVHLKLAAHRATELNWTSSSQFSLSRVARCAWAQRQRATEIAALLWKLLVLENKNWQQESHVVAFQQLQEPATMSVVLVACRRRLLQTTAHRATRLHWTEIISSVQFRSVQFRRAVCSQLYE
jgi:hypothetical protein